MVIIVAGDAWNDHTVRIPITPGSMMPTMHPEIMQQPHEFFHTIRTHRTHDRHMKRE